MSNKENELHSDVHDENEINQQDTNEAVTNKSPDDSLSDSGYADDELTNETNEEDGRIAKLEQQLQDTQDKYLRLVAEFDNFRKRTAKEKMELIKSAGEDVIKSLLDVLDDSERALKQMETSDDIDLIKEGISLVFSKLHNTLQAKGLKAMESKNQEFDAELHEAITEVPAPAEEQKGKVVDEIVKGYLLNDKIIRHAKVVVGK